MTVRRLITGKSKKTLQKSLVIGLLLIAVSGFVSMPALAAQDFSELFEKIDPSVVTIETKEIVGSDSGPRQQGGIGSGVIIGDDGLIMTAAHVVHTADRIQVKFVGGETVSAQVVSSVRGADVALLKVEKIPESAAVATIGDSKAAKTGAIALVIGAPLGVEHSLSIGHISGKATRSVIAGGAALRLVQTDASINPGNSGGPLFNQEGEVIGIVSHILSKSGGSDGIGFAVAINDAKRILLEGTAFWTGFEGEILSPAIAKMFNVKQESGLLVQRVRQGSLADKAGLKGGQIKIKVFGKDLWIGGDIILEIQNTICMSTHCFVAIRKTIDGLEPGDNVTLKVLRGGEIVELIVQL